MAVAIRTAVRLQDQDDVNVTLGADVDEYALCWDNDTSKFVLRAVGGSYLPLAGGTMAGKLAMAGYGISGIYSSIIEVDANGDADYTTIQAAINAAAGGELIRIHAGTYAEVLTVNKAVVLQGMGKTKVSGADPLTVTASASFYDVEFETTITSNNIVANLNGTDIVVKFYRCGFTNNGNTGTNITAIKATQACLVSLYQCTITLTNNTGTGTSSLYGIFDTIDYPQSWYLENTVIFLNQISSGNSTAIYKASYSTQYFDALLCSLIALAPSGTATAISSAEGGVRLYGSFTQGVQTGVAALRYDSATSATYGLIRWSGTWDSNDTVLQALAAGDVPLILKGYASQTANLQQWQNSGGAVLTYVAANGTFVVNPVTALTNTVQTVLTIGHDTSGTAAAGFGAGQLFTLESSTTAAQSAARIQALWYEATHATRKADLILSAYDTAEREGLRIRGAGSAAAIGFLGAAPAARVAHVADAKTDYGAGDLDSEGKVITAINTLNGTINSILATLESFGFHATA